MATSPRAYRLDTPDGPLFAKTLAEPRPGMFEREAAGLRALRATGAIGVPEVVREDPPGWCSSGSNPGRRGRAREADLGRRLAAVHRTTGPWFGGLEPDLGGYIGSQPVDLTPTDEWATFYVERRVRPLTARAVDAGRLDAARAAARRSRRGTRRRLCGPPEPPALLHGDLWGGNRLVDRDGANWLIDPATYWGHREVDLAMMRLFGGFGAEAFDAYDEAHPLAPAGPSGSSGTSSCRCWCTPSCSAGPTGAPRWTVLVSSSTTMTDTSTETTITAIGVGVGRPLRDRPVVRVHDHPAGEHTADDPADVSADGDPGQGERRARG